jgi:YidC/Oxa1 family membrane protein insertase
MEKRALLAITLSLAILLLWQFLFPPPKPVKTVKQPPSSQELNQVAPAPPEGKSGEPLTQEQDDAPLVPALSDKGPADLPPEQEVTVTTKLYTARLSSQGACLKTFDLLSYTDHAALPAICSVFPFSRFYDTSLINALPERKELVSNHGTSILPFQVTLDGIDSGRLARAPFTPSAGSLSLADSGPQGEISFSWTSPEGITFTKQFAFFNESYYIDCRFTIENNSARPLQLSPAFAWPLKMNPAMQNSGGGLFGGGSGDMENFLYLISDTLNRKAVADIKENKVFSGDIKWAGFEEKYFIETFIPLEAAEVKLTLVPPANNQASFQLAYPPADIQPGDRRMFSAAAYLGPKDLGHLEKGPGELGKILSFGWLDPVAKPMLYILKLFYRAIPNYGLAIIFLSIGIKIIFWPLTHKSQKSMKEMQKIQPKLAELKEKYKDNKEELNRRTLEFYRANKVNPLGGCLPILIQIPVFFALYRVLLNSIELRHAPFITYWINDLSSKDPTLISPLLMGASMFIQQKMTPTVGDPAQAKIMLIMPVMFTFMFLSFPAGLVIYWLVTNVLSIAQQYYINKQAA